MNPANSGQLRRARSRSRQRSGPGSAVDRAPSPSRPGLQAQVSQADEVHEAPQADDKLPPRPRSGSWTGINESDDELERIATVMRQPPPEIKISSASNGCSHYGSMASSVTSINNQREYEGSVGTSTTAGLFSHNLTEDRLRRRLKFFFMNPMEKWTARRRFPWKLLLQVVKIVVVTAQLCLFAQQRYNHVNYLWDTKISFSHLFIKGWDTTREIQVYPPADGPLAVYKKSEFYEYLDYAVITHAKIRELALGSYIYDQVNGTIKDPDLCMTHYASGRAFPNNTYILNGNITKDCINIPITLVNSTENWSTKDYLAEHNITFNFDLLLGVEFTFALRTIKLRVNLPFDVPECYRLIGKVLFNNHDHDGQMLVELDVGARVLECEGDVSLNKDSDMLKVWRTIINVLSIGICVTSLCMCVRAIYRAQVLKNVTVFLTLHMRIRHITFRARCGFLCHWLLRVFPTNLYANLYLSTVLRIINSKYYDYFESNSYCLLIYVVGFFFWHQSFRGLYFFLRYRAVIEKMEFAVPKKNFCAPITLKTFCLAVRLIWGAFTLKFKKFNSPIICLFITIYAYVVFLMIWDSVSMKPVLQIFEKLYFIGHLFCITSIFILIIPLHRFADIVLQMFKIMK
ncbi:unnamed protein product, partial [Meganyctiphanes norvegica]